MMSHRQRQRSVSGASLAAIALVLSATPANAYLDPGASSLILQSIIGGLVGGLFVIRTYWARLVGFFTGAGKTDDPAAAAGNDAAEAHATERAGETK